MNLLILIFVFPLHLLLPSSNVTILLNKSNSSKLLTARLALL